MIHVLGLGAGLYILNRFINPGRHQGKDGERGLLGRQGEQGVRGEQGMRGEQGLVGRRGVRGEQGTQGEQGEQGESADCKANQVSAVLTKHMQSTSSDIPEIQTNKITEGILTSRSERTNREGAVSEELRKREPLEKYGNWYNHEGKSQISADDWIHKHKADGTAEGRHPDFLPKSWTIRAGTMKTESEKLRKVAEERGVAAEELKRIRAELNNQVYRPPPLASGVIVDWKKEAQP